jgi:hypothetical protein
MACNSDVEGLSVTPPMQSVIAVIWQQPGPSQVTFTLISCELDNTLFLAAVDQWHDR